MIRKFKTLFADHPREVNETYFEHQATAFGVGMKLARMSATAFLHGIVPGVCKTAVSDEIKAMARDLGGRAEEAKECRMRDAGVWDPGL
jgi:hypothetical protein